MLSIIKKNISEKYCFILLLLIIGTSVLIDNQKLVTNIYRVLICLPILLCVRHHDASEFIKNRFVQFFIILTLWSTLTLFWPESEKPINMLTKIITTIIFLYLIYLNCTYQKKLFLNFEFFYISAAVILAVTLWITYGRLDSIKDQVFGVFGNINGVAWFLSSAALIAFYKVIYSQYKILNTLALLVIIYTLIPTRCLGSYLAICFGLFILATSLIKPLYQRWIFGMLASLLLIAIALHIIYPGFFFKIYNNFDGNRVYIYLNSYDKVTSSNWTMLFGNGLASSARNTLPTGLVINNWHSVYINMVYYCGIIGLALFLVCFTNRFYCIFTKKTKICSWDLAIAGMMITMLFDGNRIYNYPGSFFFAFMLPAFIANISHHNQESLP